MEQRTCPSFPLVICLSLWYPQLRVGIRTVKGGDMLNVSSYYKYAYKLLYISLLIFSTTFVFCMAVTNPGIQWFYRSTVPNMVNGTAYKPYVYRVLIPFIANQINSSIPEQTRNTIALVTENNTVLKPIFSDRKWAIGYASEYYVVLLLMYASLWGFVFSFKYLFRGLFKTSERFLDAVSVLTILCLSCLYWPYTYIYDFTTLFLFTLGLATMIRCAWRSYLLIFVLACLNKETTILLTCIFAIHFFKHHKLNLSTYIYLLFIQIAMFVSIKIFIDMLFIHNPGGLVEFWLPRNINLLLRPYPIILYLQWFALGFFVIYKWSEKPLFLKQGLLILIPLLGTAVFWGWIIELRAYYEAYPIVMLLLAHSVASILGLSINTQLSSGPDHQWLPVTDQYSLRKSKAAVDHPTAEIQN